MANERTCICCGKKYSYCPHCGKYSDKPRWMITFDNEVCKEVFNVVSGYNMGTMDTDKVNSVVERYHITDFTIFKDSIQKVLNEVRAVNVARDLDTQEYSEPNVEVQERLTEVALDVELENNAEQKEESVDSEFPKRKRRSVKYNQGDIEE